MSDSTPHLIITEGPEKGRELVVPPEGARLGRATENDLSVADAAMSRFQCRLYFRDGFLHVMDLGSTNETLVNDQPVSDRALRYGDEILAGESLIKVVNDGLSADSVGVAADQEPEPEPEPAPIVFNLEGGEPGASEEKTTGKEPPPADVEVEPESPEPQPHPSVVDVDLGFGRREEEEDDGEHGERKSSVVQLLVVLVTMLVVIGIGALVLMAPPGEQAGEQQQRDDTVRVYYEKVIAGDGNIFRYAVDLDRDGTLSGEVHDLQNQRSLEREEQVEEERLDRFRQQVLNQQDTFLPLQEEYRGVPAGNHESYTLTVIYGREAKTVRVANQLEPDAFKQMRERVEAFANTELNFRSYNIPPDELRAMARRSWENARKLYAERDVKNSNLWEATRKLKDVRFLLESIEPKPDYYREAVERRREWRSALMDKVGNLDFEAVRAYQVGDFARAAELYRQILATFPEKGSSIYKQAENTLIRIEQELKR